MTNSENQKLCIALLQADNEADVISLLKKAGYPLRPKSATSWSMRRMSWITVA